MQDVPRKCNKCNSCCREHRTITVTRFAFFSIVDSSAGVNEIHFVILLLLFGTYLSSFFLFWFCLLFLRFCLLFFPSQFSDSLQEATLGSVRKQNITLIVLSQKRSLLNSGVSNRVVCYQILTNFLLALALRGCRSSCDA